MPGELSKFADGKPYRGHGPDAFPCAADADALSEAHHRQNAVSVSHGAGLVPEFVVFHPVFDLLVGHVEVALLLVQGGHLCHFFRAQFKVEDLDVLLDVFGVGGDGPRPDSRPEGRTEADMGHHQRLDFHDRFRRNHAESAAR